jgi:ABC-type nitrate/sulfonate/bicarbonate transport system substrate-binding protein
LIPRRTLLQSSLATVLASGARAATPARVRIANGVGIFNQSMAALMAQQKYLESFDLKPDILGVADGSKILGAVLSQSVELSTMSGFGQVFPAIEHGANLKIIAAAATRPSLSLFSAKPNVTTLKDLEGKTVGTGSVGALIYQLTVTLLRKHQVDVSRVRFVNIGSSQDILRATRAGVVDAGSGETAMIAGAAALGIHPVANGNMTVELADYTYQGAWTSDAAIRTQRDVLVRTLAAYAKLYRFVQRPEAKDAYLQASASLFGSNGAADQLAQWDFIQTYKPFATDLTVSDARLAYMQQLNVSFDVQSKILPPNQVADMTLAADALKLLG